MNFAGEGRKLLDQGVPYFLFAVHNYLHPRPINMPIPSLQRRQYRTLLRVLVLPRPEPQRGDRSARVEFMRRRLRCYGPRSLLSLSGDHGGSEVVGEMGEARGRGGERAGGGGGGGEHG